MSRPAMLLHLKFPTEDGYCGLWLPFFLVYPILLVLSLIALPFLLLAILFTWPFGWARTPLLVLPYIWNLVFKTRGLTVDVSKPGRDILIDFV
jgi:hypothetical protein